MPNVTPTESTQPVSQSVSVETDSISTPEIAHNPNDLPVSQRETRKYQLRRKTLSTRRTPPAQQESIIVRRAQGQTISRISRDLGVSRNTVKGILEDSRTDQIVRAIRDRYPEVAVDALNTVHNAILKGDGSLAMRFLQHNDEVNGDSRKLSVPDSTLNVAINALIQTAPTPAHADPPIDAITVSTAESAENTEAAKKPPAHHVGVDERK